MGSSWEIEGFVENVYFWRKSAKVSREVKMDWRSGCDKCHGLSGAGIRDGRIEEGEEGFVE